MIVLGPARPQSGRRVDCRYYRRPRGLLRGDHSPHRRPKAQEPRATSSYRGLRVVYPRPRPVERLWLWERGHHGRRVVRHGSARRGKTHDVPRTWTGWHGCWRCWSYADLDVSFSGLLWLIGGRDLTTFPRFLQSFAPHAFLQHDSPAFLAHLNALGQRLLPRC